MLTLTIAANFAKLIFKKYAYTCWI